MKRLGWIIDFSSSNFILCPWRNHSKLHLHIGCDVCTNISDIYIIKIILNKHQEVLINSSLDRLDTFLIISLFSLNLYNSAFQKGRALQCALSLLRRDLMYFRTFLMVMAWLGPLFLMVENDCAVLYFCNLRTSAVLLLLQFTRRKAKAIFTSLEFLTMFSRGKCTVPTVSTQFLGVIWLKI